MYCREAPGQQLTRFVSNEDVLAHPCGEYVLDQLQRGVSPEDLLQVLLQEYLVQTDRLRLLAYRRFCEQRGDYWTLEHLELRYWEYLYQQLPLSAGKRAAALRCNDKKLARIHSLFCAHANVAEENVPLRVLQSF